MNNKTKNILIITMSVLTLLMLITIITLSVFLGISNNDKISWGKTDGDSIALENYEQSTYSDGILNDALSKSNTDEASIFFLTRRGSYIATQYIMDIVAQKQLNPEKEIYMGFSNTTTPDGDISGWDNWPSTIKWDNLNIDGQYFKDVSSDSFILQEKDLNKIYKKFDFDSNKKVDLYFDSYTYVSSNKNIYKNFVNEIGDYWDNINSITFYADGTAIYGMEDKYIETLKSYNTEDLENANATLTLLVNGSLSTDELSEKDMSTMSTLLPILTPNGNDDFIQVFSPSYDVYESNARVNTLQSSGAGFDAVLNELTNESMEALKTTVGLDAYEQTENYKDQEGKTNFVFSGNYVSSTSEAQSDAESIVKIYDEYKDSYAIGEANLLYKPHPRSKLDSLDEMVTIVSDLTGTDATQWLQIIPKDIPFEFFAMGNEFTDNATTSTDYQLFLTGTSTVVPALFECGITSDNVEYYIVNSEADINTLHSWYGDSRIIDYDKVIIA